MESNTKPTTPEEKANMKMPHCAQRFPKNMKLTPGEQYLYCACGLTKSPPFCDNSHIGTPFEPIPFIAKNQVYSSLCLCRRADPQALPYCDGTHTRLDF